MKLRKQFCVFVSLFLFAGNNIEAQTREPFAETAVASGNIVKHNIALENTYSKTYPADAKRVLSTGSIELFEDEADGAVTFSNNSKFFDLTSNFHVTLYTGEGYGPSNRFIDNYNHCLPAAGTVGSIKPKASGYMKITSLWLFSSVDCATVSNNGTATITGKKAGVTQYTISLASADLNNNQSVDNGFKLITFSNYAAADTKNIDELEFSVGGSLRYLAIDNFSFNYVPVTDASGVTYSNTLSNSTGISWINGTGTSRAVFMKATTSGFPSPVDNSSYVGDTVFASGTQIAGSGWYCVYNGTSTAVTVTGLSANTAYRTMVVESNGSSGSQKYTVGTTAANNPKNIATSAPPPAVSIDSHANVTCNGGSNGSATVTATGGTCPYLYSWSPGGGTAATATGLSAGTYTVTVTDAVMATNTATVTITQPTGVSVSTSSQTNIACNGGSGGSATVTVTGGTPGYLYNWAPGGGNAATATGLSAGTYTVTATDFAGCTGTKEIIITQPAAISVATTSQTNVSCNGGSNGSATVTPTGGTGSYTYSWSPSGGTAVTATGLSAGTYTVTVTDANECTSESIVTVTEPAVFTLPEITGDNSVCAGTTTNLSNSTGGGTWSGSDNAIATISTDGEVTGLTSGTITITYGVTNSNGCFASVTKSITVNTAPLMAIFTTSSAIVAAGQTGIAYGVAADPAATDYNWTYTGFGVTINSNGNKDITADFAANATSGDLQVVCTGECGISTMNATAITVTGSLPVSLVSFNAFKKVNDVEINWKTTPDIEVYKFELETSTTGTNFNRLVELSARDNNNNTTIQYAFVHVHLSAGTHLYRIKMIHRDGTFTYSNIIRVQLDGSLMNLVKVVPNPVLNRKVNLDVSNLLPGKYSVVISGTTGQIVFKQDIQNVSGTNNIQLRLPFMHQGVYTLQVKNDAGVVNIKLLVQ